MTRRASCRTLANLAALFLAVSAFNQVADSQSPFNINLDVVRRSVVFLHRKDATGNLSEAGTGFLLVVPTKSNPGVGFLLLVTARHIVDPEWDGCPPTKDILFAVLNKKNYDPQKDLAGTVDVPLVDVIDGQAAWHYPSDESVDIAVMLVNGPAFLSMDLENQPIRISQLPTEQELKLVNSGAQIASAGLLLGASGTKRNYPIFKFGNVSSVPDEKVGVACCPTCAAKLQTDWMIAASLVAGNSGSPIFFVPPSFSSQRAFLLGVQSSSFAGSDVAGMAPVQYLLNTIRALNLPDADFSTTEIAAPPSPAASSAAQPASKAVPTPIPK
jgi:hypothetical protein